MGSAFKNLFKKESSTEDEIKQLVEEDEQVGQLEKNQREMINNIFEFDDLDAGDIMTHRIDINALDCNLSIEKAVELAIEYGNSRLPVYDEDLDRICGVLYVKDLLKFVGKPISNGEKLLSYTRKPLFVPESMPCGKLFAKMTEARVMLAIVIDEYGGTASFFENATVRNFLILNFLHTESSPNIYPYRLSEFNPKCECNCFYKRGLPKVF